MYTAGMIITILLSLIVIAIAIALICGHIHEDGNVGYILIFVFSAMGILIVLWAGYFGLMDVYSSSRSAQREIIVYDENGSIIERFSGEFSISRDGDKLMFKSSDGTMHIIYFKSGTVIVNELPINN